MQMDANVTMFMHGVQLNNAVYKECAAYMDECDVLAGCWTSTTRLENSKAFHMPLTFLFKVRGLAVAAPPLQMNTFLVPSAAFPEYLS